MVAWASWFGLETESALENDVAERFTKNIIRRIAKIIANWIATNNGKSNWKL